MNCSFIMDWSLALESSALVQARKRPAAMAFSWSRTRIARDGSRSRTNIGPTRLLGRDLPRSRRVWRETITCGCIMFG